MPSGGNNRMRFGIDFDVNKTSLNDVVKTLQQISNINIGSGIAAGQKQLIAAKETAGQLLTLLQDSFNVKLDSLNIDKFKTSFKEAGLTIQGVAANLQGIGPSGQRAFNQFSTAVLTSNVQLKETNNLVNQMGTTMMNTVKWGVASSIFNNITSSVQQAFTYVKSLDSALTDIRIVTGDSRDQMAKFADEANRAAQSLGRSTMEYSKAALTYYQQGLSDEDVQARTEATLKAQNITGAGSQMADYLTAVWNGYKVANEEAQLYVDKLAAVADSSASNMSQLAVAMSKVASTANMLGVPVDSLNAQIATIVATTRQAPESVGNALKTIYARINDIATGADDAEISLGNYTSKMAELGINVLDANGKLRDTGDVIDQIGGKWQTLSREQQIYLARTMAGQRQYNNLLALFENWGKYTDLVNVSMDAQGATMEKNSRYMESLEAHLNQLGAASERLKAAMIDSDSFKGLIDFGTQAVQVFANFIEAIGGGGNALLMLGSIATQVFSGVISREMIKMISNMQAAQFNARQLQSDIDFTQAFIQAGQHDPFPKTTQQLLELKTTAQSYYSSMSNEQVNTYQNMLKEFGKYREQEQHYERMVGLANQLAKTNAKNNDAGGFKIFGESEQGNFNQFQAAIQQNIDKMKMLEQQGKTSINAISNAVRGMAGNFATNFGDEALGFFGEIQTDSGEVIKNFTDLNKGYQQGKISLNEYQRIVQSFFQQIKNANPQNLAKLEILWQRNQNAATNAKNAVIEYRDGLKQAYNIQQITKFLGVLGQCVAVLNSFANIGRIIKNDSLSLGEKILQISQVLISSGVLIVNIVKTTKQLFETTVARLAIEKGITRQKQKQAAIDAAQAKVDSAQAARKAYLKENGPWNKMKGPQRNEYQELKQAADAAKEARKEALGADATSDMDIFKLGLKDVGANISKFLTSPMKIFGAQLGISVGATLGWAAAIVAVGYAAYKIYNQAADAAKKARENAQQAQKLYKDTRQTVNNLNSSLQSLNSAKNELKDLTKGTEEWQTALGKVNQQVLQLVETFPQLKQYLTSNDGQLGFKEGAQQQVQELYARRTTAQGMAYASADYTATQAENRSSIVDASREYDGIGGQITEQSLTEVVNAINQFGDDILKNSQTLQDNTSLTKFQADAMIQHRAKIIELAHSVDGNIKASQALRSAIIDNHIIQSSQYQGLDNPDAQAAFIKLVEQGFNNAQLDESKYYVRTADGTLNDDPAKLVERFNEIKGTNYTSNFWGTIKNDSGQPVAQSVIEDAVAYADALEDADTIYNDALNIIKQLGDNGARIYSNFSKNTADLANLSEEDFQNILPGSDLFNKIAQVMQLDPKEDNAEIQEKLSKYKERTIQLSNEYIESLPFGVQDAFEKIDRTKISLTAQKQIGQILNGAFVQGKGLENYQDKIAQFFGDVIDAGKIQDALNIDLSNIHSLDDFKTEIQKVTGVAPPAKEALEVLYNTLKGIQDEAMTPEQIYNAIHGVTDKKNGKILQRYDIVTEQQINALKQAGIDVEYYFQRMYNGNYQLIKSAEQFYKYANGVSLQPFKNEIKGLQDQLDNSVNYNYSDLNQQTYSMKDIAGGRRQTLNRESINYSLVQDQVNALNNIGAIDQQQLTDYNDLIEHRKMDLQTLQQIGQQIRKNKEELQNYQSSVIQNLSVQQLQAAYSQQDLGEFRDLKSEEGFKNLAISADEYVDSLLSVANAQGIEIDNARALAEEWIKNADSIEGVNKNLKDNETLSYDLAVSMEDLISGIESIQDSWKETLKEGVTQPTAEVVEETRAALSDMFNVDVDPDFVYNNLDTIRQLAQGNMNALGELRTALLNTGLQALELSEELKLKIATQMDWESFDSGFAELQTLISNSSGYLNTIQVGTNIEEAPFYEALDDFVKKAGLTETQINELFGRIGYEPQISTKTIDSIAEVQGDQKTGYYIQTDVGDGQIVKSYVTQDQYNTLASGTAIKVPVIKPHTYTYRGGGNAVSTFGGNRVVPKAPSSSGNKGNKGSTKKPTVVKPTAAPTKKQHVESNTDPYHDINKALKKQEDQIDKISKKDKKLVNRDRLKNIEAQNKALEEQNDLLSTKTDIAQGEKIRLKNELTASLGDAIKFNPDGSIANYNQAVEAATANYNEAVDKRNDTVNKAYNRYAEYVAKYNKMSVADQQKNKATLEKIKEEYTAIVKKEDEALKLEEQKKKTTLDSLKTYEDTQDIIDDNNKQIQQNLEKQYENNIQAFNLKVQLKLDAGEFERDWLDFENKFIKKLEDDNFVGKSTASIKNIMSYVQSGQLEAADQHIKDIQKEIAIMQANGTSKIYGDNKAQAKKDLEEWMKNQENALLDIQDQIDQIKENYLDALDEAKDKMDDQIDQYERVNSLIDHNVKLVQMIYGDKAYNTMQKYYELQKKNNEDELNTLRQNQLYWQNLYDHVKRDENGNVINKEEYQRIKENLDDITDQLNSKLEDMVDKLASQFENRLNSIISNLNLSLTGGRGLDYLDEQWDYINNYDDQFLDTFESKMGIQEVQDLYQQAIDGLNGSPANQQKINKLMNQQLKMLREKDALTQYDIDRAKASLEVEKARMALEDARYNKTKMRLRRDSQGNYTYQYVADQEKLSDLQSALADAQSNLYNMDKEHYKENLNALYDTYKNHLEKMSDLAKEYQTTQDEEERARIKARAENAIKQADRLFSSLSQDNKSTFKFLTGSYLTGMDIDPSLLSLEEQVAIINQNVPQAQSNIQDLVNTINGKGGLAQATADPISEAADALQDYDKNLNQILGDAGTDLSTITNVVDEEGNALDKNITQAQQIIDTNKQLVESCKEQVAAMQELINTANELLGKDIDIAKFVATLRGGHDTNQELNDSSFKASDVPITDTTLGETSYTGNPSTDTASLRQQITALLEEYEKFLQEMSIATFDTGGATGSWGDASGRLAFLHEKELVLNQEDTANILAVVESVRSITSALNGVTNGEIASLVANATGLMGSLNTASQLDQNVHIEANFPNVTQHTEIEQAFENLVNMASMHASKYRD